MVLCECVGGDAPHDAGLRDAGPCTDAEPGLPRERAAAQPRAERAPVAGAAFGGHGERSRLHLLLMFRCCICIVSKKIQIQ